MNISLLTVCVVCAISMCSAVKTDNSMIVKTSREYATANNDDEDRPIIMHVVMDRDISKTNRPATVTILYEHTSQEGICKVSLPVYGGWQTELHIQESISIWTDKIII